MILALPSANAALIRAFVLPFALLAAALVAGAIILRGLGIGIDQDSWRTMLGLVIVSGGLVLIAGRIGNRAATASALSIALFLSMPAPLAVFSYACAALGASLPLMDAVLARIDAQLGFDWLPVVAWFNRSPAGIAVLGAAYHGTIAALVYGLVFLNLIGRRDRLVELAVMVIGTCLIANILSGVVPAAGAYVHFQPDETVRGAISADAGIWHLVHFEALRSGSFSRFSLSATEGLVTFPSFHTAAAMCVPLALRGYGPLTALAWLAAAAIIVSTIPIGGHYLIDVVAGAAITLALHALLRARGIGRRAIEPGAVASPARDIATALRI